MTLLRRHPMRDKNAFVGDHPRYDDLGNQNGSFTVFRLGSDWYWQPRNPGKRLGEVKPFGPFKTAEAAYLSAIGE